MPHRPRLRTRATAQAMAENLVPRLQAAGMRFETV